MRDLEVNIIAKDRTAPGFDSAEARGRKFNGAIKESAAGLDLASTAAKAFTAAFTLTAVEGFASAVHSTISRAADLADMADKVGVSTDDLQRLQYGLEVAGVAAEDVDQILTQWSKRIGEAYTHGGRLAEIFAANNISLTDAEGHLRSAVDLMRDYANLVSFAGSDQERMSLATEAFGKAGSSMVLAMRDGADGINKFMGLADDAGGILDEQLLRKAGDIDDAFNKMWRNFELNAKRSILVGGDAVDRFAKWWQDAQRDQPGPFPFDEEQLKQPAQTQHGNRVWSSVDHRVAAAFDVTAADGTDDGLARMLRDRFGKRTVIPADPQKGQKDAADHESDYDKVIKKLEEERSLIMLSATDQKVLTEQRKAGVESASAQGQAIASLVRQIDAENTAVEASRKRYQDFERSVGEAFERTGDALLTIADHSEKASTALAKLAVNFVLAATQAAAFHSGPLAGIWGMIGGSIPTPPPSSSGSWSLGLDDFHSFDGGGSTGAAARSGGLDGRGGFLALMHPQETVIDHTKGGMRSSPINVYIQTPDAQSFNKSRSQVETSIARAVNRAGRSM